jgi:DnaJ-class molecular chaperone
MGTTVTERRTERTTERATWSCPNCQGETSTAKKRCRDCGTSRF